MKKISVPVEVRKEWTWNHREFPGGYSYDGVHTHEGCLVWFTEYYPGWAGGGACRQSFEDFLENGPSVGGVPENVVSELNELLESLLKK